MYKNNTNKGITLIALVITIIVMLILVAVTISMAVNGGLFEYAGKATGDTKNAINEEQRLANGKIKIDGKWYASIDDYLNNNPIESGLEINSTEITLKKKETGAEGEEVLTSIITASVFGMENEPEITWETSSDAIELSATTGKTITVTAVGTKNEEVTITAKCTYDGKEYTAESKITLEIIKTIITAPMVQSDLSTYLGKTVNYGVYYYDTTLGVNGRGKWVLLSADMEHIYLIMYGMDTESKLDSKISGYNGTSDFTAENGLANYPAVAQGLLYETYDPNAAGTEEDPYLKYSSSHDNMKATQYLLDSTKWTTYTNNYADWAIGAPTAELVDGVGSSPSGTGYGSINFGKCRNVLWHAGLIYWFACPSTSNDGDSLAVFYGPSSSLATLELNQRASFRPVICLKSDVGMVWNSSTSQYDLVFM